jgi:myo-inositol-1(or 4)-monophosphatase
MEATMNLRKAQNLAVAAAREVGVLMRRHLRSNKVAHLVTQHDIKLDLDVRSQKLIERTLRSTFSQVALLGEEGTAGAADAEYRWVVDPIDGTVNFAYGIPHACVSIALQQCGQDPRSGTSGQGQSTEDYHTLVGVVYDPFSDELWTAMRGGSARLNGRIIYVSRREKLSEAIVSIGFAKSPESIRATLPYFSKLIYRVRKVRMMGAAALGLAYVATGRFDAYLEASIRLWDIAAGGFILECAGGEFWRRPMLGEHAYRVIATNGSLRRKLRVPD